MSSYISDVNFRMYMSMSLVSQIILKIADYVKKWDMHFATATSI